MKFNPNCKNPGTCEDCRDRCIQDIAFLYGMPEEKQLDILCRSAHKIFNRGDFLFHEGDKGDRSSSAPMRRTAGKTSSVFFPITTPSGRECSRETVSIPTRRCA